MTDYGSGVFLDENLDFEVDSSGDIASSSGPDELRKDLSFNIIRALRYGDGIETPESIANGGVTGSPLSQGVRSDIELAVRNVVSDDDRIDFVTSVDATASTDSRNQIDVTVTAQVVDETVEFELVISV